MHLKAGTWVTTIPYNPYRLFGSWWQQCDGNLELHLDGGWPSGVDERWEAMEVSAAALWVARNAAFGAP